MSQEKPVPTRFIGLDVHKHYLVAIGVDTELNQVLGPRRVPLAHLDSWMGKALTLQDAVVLEMTTNAFQLYDDLLPHVHSVTLVHPPHVTLITRAQVMTDKMAALVLARLHAVGLLPPVWVPPLGVRDQRALVAHRTILVRLSTQAKNRLHALLHRYHLPLALHLAQTLKRLIGEQELSRELYHVLTKFLTQLCDVAHLNPPWVSYLNPIIPVDPSEEQATKLTHRSFVHRTPEKGLTKSISYGIINEK